MLEQPKEFKPLSFREHLKLQQKLERELEELLKPAEVIFEPERNRDIEQLVEAYLNKNKVSTSDKKQISHLSFLLAKEKDYHKYLTIYNEFEEILAKYK